jgi:hypothetical protein
VYPGEGESPRTTIAIHVSQSLKARAATKLLLGCKRAINLPGRQSVLLIEQQASTIVSSVV